ncbi:hypothetical protein OIDMADRAFT_61195 [Oidiodendron maius Zn]|uniref:Uncharacterized protein n=1 Tax=Oidiodendron maius (strain Zn) TaxID=913774 RepID=A0A0C3C4T8_OIDMZ|nr:hypothetical protein OIDMADRAFT_61195 [Oidiodendron maius Zn]
MGGGEVSVLHGRGYLVTESPAEGLGFGREAGGTSSVGGQFDELLVGAAKPEDYVEARDWVRVVFMSERAGATDSTVSRRIPSTERRRLALCALIGERDTEEYEKKAA